MNSISILKRAVALGLLTGGAALANASPQTWTLENVMFSDGTEATGSFTYDAPPTSTPTPTDYALSYSISVTGGTFPAMTYDGTDSFEYNSVSQGYDALNELTLVANDYSTDINLNFASMLTDAGGTVALILGAPNTAGGSWVGTADGITTFYATQGEVTTVAAVPEPASLALCGVAGLALLGARRRKRS